ncbi:GNAT family N-acyltransferase [Phaeocystidibacter marisrubri]|uniref:Lysophospholipid acyltransferase family protein n=1 Tax=Phaeocystidibacter marisrubri TaxID=1577780 RepID=A0A6L3ZHH5_9FLAO|nr:lysophospholipid acyltransferase family protein [Phaeocystidibacter marisrubri]KAB2817089.1 lysophospholipid acyltransferase family protein [Phaeocystidibacter marisrubri]GGH76907.1 glycerol acyltransferase [Phaeocystidibacter marisrubri]
MKQTKQLVAKNDLAKAAKLDKIGMSWLAGVIMDITKLTEVNALYERFGDKTGIDFIDAVFEELEIEFNYFEDELKRIPKEGPFITVSNHPLGGIDGLVLLKIISMVRPDYKVMANFLLKKIETLEDQFIAVNPFETRKDAFNSSTGLKEAIQHLKDGHGLGIFPAGEVSAYKFGERKVIDREWQDGAIKLIEKMGVPVVPVYFKAKNSSLFYVLASLSSTLQTAKLPSELLTQRNKQILVRVGKPVEKKEMEECKNSVETMELLRERTYRLSSPLEDPTRLERLKKVVSRPPKAPAPIVSETPQQLIWDEIEDLREKGGRMTEFRTFEVFCAAAPDIPNILREIGRLREITFRKVGEGTNEETDLDDYDQVYLHLFLWDNQAQRIAGAYRLGMGADIYKENGIKGFYVNSLFRIEEDAFPIFSKSLEMGRAFIIEEYQQKPMPLFLLWKGIVHVILRNPDKVRYLTGCVSISNQFSKFSKAMMISYVQHHFFDAELGKHIHPRKEFRVRLSEEDEKFIRNSSGDDLNKFDRFIDEVEPGNMRFPVLFKKYIKQNAKIVCFNVDPKFNNSIDGFMYIDINDLPEQTIQPVLEELEEATKQEGRK